MRSANRVSEDRAKHESKAFAEMQGTESREHEHPSRIKRRVDAHDPEAHDGK